MSMNKLFRLKKRHTVLSILFGGWIVSHMDRMAMAVALPYISTDFQLTPVQSGALMSAFFVGYSLMHIPGGVLADKFGVRRVAAGASVWWSAFTAITGVAANFMQMLWVRLFFGLGEGVFPACAFKTIAVWFSKKERATANAVMLAANPLGIALSPIIVVAIMSTWGWRGVFFALFVPGIVVALLFWIFIPDNPPAACQADGEAIASHESENEAHSDPHSQSLMNQVAPAIFALCRPYRSLTILSPQRSDRKRQKNSNQQ